MLEFPPDPPPVVGQATIIDGDTLEVAGRRFHLWGIDAPEIDQTCERADIEFNCGQEAKAHLRSLVSDRTVSCVPMSEPDRQGATVGICSVVYRVSQSDAGRDMVQDGWAVERARLSDGRYRFSQDRAKDMRLGLWMGRFEMPWEWRARHPAP